MSETFRTLLEEVGILGLVIRVGKSVSQYYVLY